MLTGLISDTKITRGVWKSRNPESGTGAGNGNGNGTGTGTGT